MAGVHREAEERPVAPGTATPAPPEQAFGISRNIMDQMGECVAIYELDGTLVYANPAMCELVGRPPETLVGKNLSQLFSEARDDGCHLAFRRVVASGGRVDFEHYYASVNRWFDHRVFREGSRVVVIGTDITARKTATTNLYAITDALPLLVALVGSDERYQFVNRTYEHWFGQAPEDLLGKSLREVLGANAYASVEPHVRTVLSGKEVAFETRISYAHGGARDVRSKYVPLREGDRVVGYVGLVFDITEQKRSDERVRHVANRMQSLVDNLVDAVITIDSCGIVQAFNRAAENLFGYAAAEVMGRNVKMLMPEPYFGEHDGYIESYVKTGHAKVIGIGREVTGKRKDGSTFPMDLAVSEYRIGEDRYFTGVTRDITERKLAEDALRASEERFQAAVRATNDAIWDWNLVTNAVWWGDGLANLFGYSASEIGPDAAWRHEHVHPEDREHVVNSIHTAIDSGASQWREEYRFLRANGSTAFVLDRGHVIRDESGNAVRMIGAMQDITERIEAEAALRKTEKMNAIIAQNATLGLLMLDARQHCTFMNPAAEQITGFRLEDVQGKPLHYFVHPSRADGTPYPIEDCPIDRALPTRSEQSGEDEFFHKDGRFYPVAFTASPIVDAGQPVGTVIEVRDTTREKEIERNLRGAIAARDEFLSVASHELRTPLTALGLQLERLEKLLVRAAPDGDRPKALKNVEVALKQAGRLEGLVEGLLNVSRISTGRLQLHVQLFDMGELARDLVERLGALAARSHCELRLELGTDLAGTWDRERVDEVLMNLVSNAIKYGPGKPIDLTVQASGDVVVISVRDYGIGISVDAQGRIFGLFERAVSATNYGGLGLGLYIARQVVEAHGGHISVTSAEGEGSTFTVRLPRFSIQAREEPPVENEAHR
jgi:PAS domain S-box-containing protein